MNRGAIAGSMAILAAALALPAVTGGYEVNILTQIYLYAYLASAWNLMAISGLISLGHAAFFGLGSYTTVWLFLTYGVPPALGWIGGAILAAGLALAVYWVTFRCGLRGIYFGGLTLVLAEAFRFAAINSPALGRSQGLELLRFHVSSWFLYSLALLCMAGIILLTRWLLRSPFGYRLQAIRQNEVAAESLGVDTFRTKLTGAVLSAALTAIGGTIHALLLRFVEPELDFGIGVSLNLLLGTFLGGTGTVWGPAVGIAVLFALREGIALAGEAVAMGTGGIYAAQHITYGLILMVVVLCIPEGLIGRASHWLSRRRRRPSARGAPPSRAPVVAVERKSAPVPPNGSKPVLEVIELTKAFNGLMALNQVTFRLHAGEILGVIGPNGAGKTTLFNVISGLYAPTRGTVKFRGENLAGMIPNRICRRGVARTFQVVRPFSSLSVRDNVVIGALARCPTLQSAQRLALESLQFVGLDTRRDAPAGALTLQERKLLEFARALATEPNLLLLDEVMAGLNEGEQEQVMATVRRIRERGVTLLVIEHVMRAIMSFSDRLLVLDHGSVIAEGTPEAVGRDPKVVQVYLGTAVSRGG